MAALGSRNIPRVWIEFGIESRQPAAGRVCVMPLVWLTIREMSWLSSRFLENGVGPSAQRRAILLQPGRTRPAGLVFVPLGMSGQLDLVQAVLISCSAS
jgi:hypothetical protein